MNKRVTRATTLGPIPIFIADTTLLLMGDFQPVVMNLTYITAAGFQHRSCGGMARHKEESFGEVACGHLEIHLS